MANKVVNATQLDADLLSVANAIRGKGGTSAALQFPDEFIAAINDIHGGGGDAYAAISVTYPEGSICTCSQAGQTTLTAGDTSGIWLFVVPVGGEWTITITDGENTKSENVEITAQGQVETIAIAFYNGELYWLGDEFSSITGGWEDIGNTGRFTKYDTYMRLAESKDGTFVLTGNKINISNYSTLHVHVSATAGAYAYTCAARTHDRADVANSPFGATILNSVGDFTIDLTGAKTSGYNELYFALAAYSTSSARTIDIDKVWLE